LEFENVGFCGGKKTGVPGEKFSEQGENQPKTQPTYGHQAGIEPGSHWWEATVLATVTFLLPKYTNLFDDVRNSADQHI